MYAIDYDSDTIESVDDQPAEIMHTWAQSNLNMQGMRNGFIEQYIYSEEELEDIKL